MSRQVLLIEDDAPLRQSLAQALELDDMEVVATDNFLQARRIIRANYPGVVLSDIRMPDHDGFEVLQTAQAADPQLPVILLTGAGDVPMALRAVRGGAYEFLEKPCPTERLLEVLNRALDHRALILQNRRMEQALLRNDAAAVHFPGPSEAAKTLRRALRDAAQTSAHVHFWGAAGAGKRLAAYTLHKLSETEERFISMVPGRALAHDLGGIDMDAGPIAVSVKRLDETTPEDQTLMLSLIETVPTLRFLTSAERQLEDLLRAGVSEGLINALAATEIHLPALAARRADIGVIFDELVRQSARNQNEDMPIIPEPVLAEVMSRDWSGNLAELRNYAKSFVLGARLRAEPGLGQGFAEQMDNFERLVLSEALKRHNGRASAAAAELNLPRKTFYDRLARHDIRPKSFRPTPSDEG